MKGQSSFKTTLVCLVAICFVKDVDLEVPRPRGVPVESKNIKNSAISADRSNMRHQSFKFLGLPLLLTFVKNKFMK